MVWIAISMAVLLQPKTELLSQGTGQPVVVRSVSVRQVPHPVGRDFWDGSFIGNLLSGAPLAFQPDIRICLEWGAGRKSCTAVCPDTYQCTQLLGTTGFALDATKPRLHVRILDDDPPESELIADLPDVDPTKCPDSAPCSINVNGEAAIISFDLAGGAGAGGGGGGGGGAPHAAPPPAPTTAALTVELPKDGLPSVVMLKDEKGLSTLTLKGKPFIKGANDSCCVHYNDVGQGQNGNCFLLSSLAAIARVSPGTISNAIKDNGNGTYDVTLYVPNSQHKLQQTVVSGLDAAFPSRGWYSTLENNPFIFAQPGDTQGTWLPSFSWTVGGFKDYELWVMLMEKAYAEVHGGYTGNSFRSGEAASYALQTITGTISGRLLIAPGPIASQLSASERASTLSTRAALDSFLAKTVASAHPMVVGTVPDCMSGPMVDAQGLPTQEFRCTPRGDQLFEDGKGPLVRNHSYYVIEYSGGVITLGNPWSNSPAVQLNLDQFAHAFRQIHSSPALATLPCQCK